MSFWSSQRIEKEQKKLVLVHPFLQSHILHGAYHLSLSREVLVTPDGKTDCLKPGEGPTLSIPPGQFAILYTNETVTIPTNVLGFISIRSMAKFKGLVNISGFHVDPGYSGHLKFTVFNAGNKPIHLAYDEIYFPLWFAELDDHTTDPYGKGLVDGRISTDEREQMSEPRHSADTLHKRLEKLETKAEQIVAVGLIIVIPLLIGIFIAIFTPWFEHKSLPEQRLITNEHELYTNNSLSSVSTNSPISLCSEKTIPASSKTQTNEVNTPKHDSKPNN